jgi:pSer/pThr/pTyr-binding forkhead associated (FHA) protein
MKDTLLHDLLAAGFVGAGIGAGLMGLSGRGKLQTALRLLSGLGGGFVAGAIGGVLGNLLVDKLHLPRSIGWTMMGLFIGSIEGIYEQSLTKLRNGLIGGALGGLLGGLLFDPIARTVQTSHGFTSRAAGFVILGLAIGCLIGLVQVVLRDAWVTVIDGYRPGRQVILSQPVTLLGRGEWVALPFMGSFGNALDMEHLRIVRQSDGSFSAEDNDTKNGSEVNRRRIDGPTPLQDGDTIKIGNNIVRFNEKAKKETEKRERRESEPVARQATRSGMAPVAAPPPPPPRTMAAPPPPPVAVKFEVISPIVAKSATKVLEEPPLVLEMERMPPPPPPPPSAKPQVNPPPPAASKPDAKAPPPPPASTSEDACPGCKRKVPGRKGTRYCMVCDITF